MSKRTETALAVLAEGGYFRQALERGFHGREQFKIRLRTKVGAVVKGVGHSTFHELIGGGKLISRPCAKGSAFATEWELWQI